MRLIDFLGEFHPPTPRQHWQQWIARGEITFDGGVVHEDQLVHSGERYLHTQPGYVEPPVNATIGIIYDDEHLLVVDKPAPLPVHPSGRFNRNTLVNLLATVYPNDRLRIAHRLDANTTGVVVFCRTATAAAFVQPQFEQRSVEKHYLVRVIGHIQWEKKRCEFPIGQSPPQRHAKPSDVDATATIDTSIGISNGTARLGESGSSNGGARITHRDGRPAETLFRRLMLCDDNTTLLHAMPLTGRTNQIRVHAAALGFPVQGDPFYNQPPGETPAQTRPTQTLGIDDPPMCLHASQIAITHPTTHQTIRFETDLPTWAEPHVGESL